MSELVNVDVQDQIATIVLNRPDKHNALSFDMFRELAEVGDQIIADRSIRAAVVSGSGENFCAGIDTSVFTAGVDLAEALKPLPPSPANVFQRATYVWREVPVPVICAIHGVAYGAGLQLALGADIRYASPSARLSVMEVKWGIIPDLGISVLARHVVPPDKLREITYTGRVLSSSEALELGLLTAVHNDPLAAAQQIASEIASKSPDAIRSMKRLFNEAWQLSPEESLRLEADLQSAIIGSRNQLEAVAANIEKRPPKFQD